MSVFKISNLISEESANAIISTLDPLSQYTPREKVKVALGFDPAMAARVGIEEDVPNDTLNKDITKAFQKSLESVQNIFGKDISLVQSFYNSMEPGAVHGLHCDNCNLDGSPLQEGVEEPNKWSAILYLNTQNKDFSGGEVVFPKQDTKLSPVAGDFVFFKTDVDHPHEVLEITSGERKCLVFFYGDKYDENNPTTWTAYN